VTGGGKWEWKWDGGWKGRESPSREGVFYVAGERKVEYRMEVKNG